ncbi:BTAD domain-containing putative transcriptional regulator [Streptomyces sp. NPDC059918]|uniref:BTAD domain-containing putative transcriptional regulator n=1 Tax=unclassified Streptomyces TaxID=2593676 RepID=UPI0036696DBF
MTGHSLRFSLLGPLEVRCGDRQIDLGPPKRRILLIRLLLSAGQAVSVDQLCADLWERQRHPAGAVSSVHSHISRLRSALEPDRGRDTKSTLLVRESGGYVLAAGAQDLDTHVFEAALHEAREARAASDPAAARRALERGLGLWRGETALQDAAAHRFAEQEAARLMGMRQLAEEMLAGILLAEGDVDAAIGITERLTKSAPLREEAWEVLLRALHRAGRSGEALQQYARLRTILAEELGVDPGPALRELHLAIVRHDPAASGPVPSEPVSSGATEWGPPVAPASGGRQARRPDDAATATPTAPVETKGIRALGREDEADRLREVVAASPKGARWAVVAGDTGSGKRDLLSSAVSYATAHGFTVARLGCRDADRGGAADSPAERLLAELRAVRAPADCSARSGIACAHRPAPDLLRQLRQRPVLYVLDDLDEQCADCLAFLRRLASLLRDEPVAVVVSVRDSRTPALAGLMADLAYAGAEYIPLKPLDAAGVARILCAREEDGSPEAAAALHRRSEGNHFVLRELLALEPRHRTGPGARLPLAVEAVLLPRIMVLPEAARLMLANAAAAGEVLDLGLLAAAQELSARELLALVDAAIGAGVLTWEGGPGYRFSGPMRDVVLATLTPAGRQVRLAVLADAAERLAPSPAGLHEAVRSFRANAVGSTAPDGVRAVVLRLPRAADGMTGSLERRRICCSFG